MHVLKQGFRERRGLNLGSSGVVDPGSNSAGSCNRGKVGVLFPCFSKEKAFGEVQTDYQSETIEPLGLVKMVPHGVNLFHQNSASPGAFPSHLGFKGCLSSRANKTSIPEIAQVCGERPRGYGTFSVCSPACWAVLRSKGIFKNPDGNFSPFKRERHPGGPVFGRPSVLWSLVGTSLCKFKNSHRSLKQPGLANKFRQVMYDL